MDANDSRKRRTAILKSLSIPSASPSAERILELVMDDSIDLPSMAQVIQSEPGITARIIGLANSAYFNPPGTIYTVEEAMVKVLGLQTVRNLVMGLLLGSKFNISQCISFSITRYWCNSLTVAQSASQFAKVSRKANPNAAYLAGLLHSMGQLMQVHHFPKEMAQILPMTSDINDRDRLEIERETLGFDSTEVGSWLAKRWGLPDETIYTLAFYPVTNYLGEHWQIVRIVGAIVRYYQSGLTEELVGLCILLDLEQSAVDGLVNTFSNIADSVSVLAEHMVAHE